MVFYADIRAGPADISLNANYVRLVLEERSDWVGDDPALEISECYLERITKEIEGEIWRLFTLNKPVDLVEIILALAPDNEKG